MNSKLSLIDFVHYKVYIRPDGSLGDYECVYTGNKNLTFKVFIHEYENSNLYHCPNLSSLNKKNMLMTHSILWKYKGTTIHEFDNLWPEEVNKEKLENRIKEIQ